MSQVFDGVQSAAYNADNRNNVSLDYPEGRRYDRHILTIVTTGTPSAGTVTVRRKARGSNRYIQLADSLGVARNIALATEDSVIIEGPIDGVQLDIASLATATGWYALLSPIGD